jgi:hypothetical protein
MDLGVLRMSSCLLIIYDEKPQVSSSRRIMLKKEAKKIFANPQSVILMKSGMMKVFKLKRMLLCLLFDLEYRQCHTTKRDATLIALLMTRCSNLTFQLLT